MRSLSSFGDGDHHVGVVIVADMKYVETGDILHIMIVANIQLFETLNMSKHVIFSIS